jgi:hypothetical protein
MLLNPVFEDLRKPKVPNTNEGMTLRIIGPTGPSRGILSFWWTRGISVPHTC